MYSLVKNYARQLLLRSQGITGTDNLYLARGGFWLSAGFTINTLVSLGLTVAFANLIPKEVYGAYKYVLSLVGALGFLTITGMNTAVSQMVAQGHRGILPYSVMLQLKWNFLYTIAALGLAAYYAIQGNMTLAISIAIIGVTFPISAACNTYGAYLSGRKDFRRATGIGTAVSLIQSSSILLTILLWPSVISFVVAYSLSLLIPTVLFCVRYIRHDHAIVSDTDKSALRRYAGHLTFLNVISTIDSYLDKILLFQNIGAVQLATYSLALAAPERIRGYLKNIGGMLLPRLAERSLADIRRVYYIRLGQGLIIGTGIAALYWFVSPLLFRIFLPQYLEAIPFSRALGIVNAFVIPTSYMAAILRAHRMMRAMYLSSGGAHSFRIIAYIVLIPMFGIWGIIYAMLATQLGGLLYNMVIWEIESRRLLRIG